VFKKLVSVFGVHNVKTQFVPSLCQQCITFPFKFPTKDTPIPAAARLKASVCVARFLGLRVRTPPGDWMSYFPYYRNTAITEAKQLYSSTVTQNSRTQH